MQPSATDRDARVALGLFLLVWAAYAFFWGGGGWAQNSHFALTRSLVLDGDVQIDEYAATTGDVSRVGGRLVTNKAPGLSVLAVPGYAASLLLVPGAEEGIVVTIRAWVTNLFSNALLGALVAPLLYLHARRMDATPRRALLVALVVAFATPLLPYATVFFLHDASGALMLAAWLLAMRPSPGRAAAAGFVAALAAFTNYLFLPGLAAIALLAGHEARRARGWRAGFATLGAAAAGALPALALFALYQLAAVGRVFDLALNENPQFVDREALLFGLIGYPDLGAAWGITFSPYRGLFYLAPVLLLAIPGALAMIRARAWPAIAFVAFNVAVFLGFNVTFNGWEGGFGIGARYLVPLVPLLGVVLVHALRNVPVWVFVVLAAVSFANNFAATAVDQLPSGSIGDPLGEYVYPLLLTGTWTPSQPMHPRWTPEYVHGHTSVSRHGIDESLPFQKEPPGSFESEWAAFNLGEVVTGPGSAPSVVPVLLLMAAGIAALFRATRSSR